MAMAPNTPQEMLAMAQYLRQKGMTEEQIEQVLGGDPTEFQGARDLFAMSQIPTTAALKDDAKNVFGAAGNFLSGMHSKRQRDEFKEMSDQFKKGNILRRKTQIDMLDPEGAMRRDPRMAADRAGLAGLQALSGEEAGGLPGLAAAEEDPEEILRRLTGG